MMQKTNKNGAALIAAAVVVYLLAFAAFLGAASDGDIDLAWFFHFESPYAWSWYEALRDDNLDFWSLQFGNANLLFDMAIIFPLFAAFGYAGALWLWAFLTPIISVAGWIVLSAAVFGKSENRAATIIFAHALPFMLMAYGIGDIFFVLNYPLYHTTSWITMPWLLWFGVRILQGGDNRYVGAMAIMVMASVANNPIVLPWFVAPFFVALYLACKTTGGKAGKRLSAVCVKLAMTTAAGVICGYIVSKLLPATDSAYSGRVFSLPSFHQVVDTLGNIADFFVLVAKHNFLLLIVFALFVFVVLRYIGQGETPARKMLLFFVPLSMAASLAAAVATGLFPFIDEDAFIAAGGFGDKRYIGFFPPEREMFSTMRYMQPLFFFPLFAGWILYLPKIRARIIGAAALLVFVVAVPRIAVLDLDKLNPRSHPFYDCFTEAVQRLNAKSVIMGGTGSEPYAVAGLQWDNYIFAGVARGKDSYVYFDLAWGNQTAKREVDIVVANASGGKFGVMLPEREPYICSYEEWNKCVSRFHPALVLDGQAIRGAFGEPAEVIHCPDHAAIYHYNPPIVLQHTDRSRPVGNRFDASGWSMPTDK